MKIFTKVTASDQIAIVENLADEIWREHYVPIIGEAQVDYMLDKFQAKAAIDDQIKHQDFQYYLINECGTPIGYFAVKPREHEMFLSKIYIKSSTRGKGRGKAAMQFIENLTRENGNNKLTLTVNKHNSGTIRAYEKLGFKNAGPVVTDIGGGFIMDDYKMEKTIN